MPRDESAVPDTASRRLVLGVVLGATSGALAVGEMRAFHPAGGATFRVALYCLLAGVLALDLCLGEPPKTRLSRVQTQSALSFGAVWAVTSIMGATLGDGTTSAALVVASFAGMALGWATFEVCLLVELARGEEVWRGPGALSLVPAFGPALALPVVASPDLDVLWFGPLPVIAGLAVGLLAGLAGGRLAQRVVS